MYCKNCGKEIIDGDKFCSYCGCQVSEKAKTIKRNGRQDNNTQNSENTEKKNSYVFLIIPAIVYLIMGIIGSIYGNTRVVNGFLRPTSKTYDVLADKIYVSANLFIAIIVAGVVLLTLGMFLKLRKVKIKPVVRKIVGIVLFIFGIIFSIILSIPYMSFNREHERLMAQMEKMYEIDVQETSLDANEKEIEEPVETENNTESFENLGWGDEYIPIENNTVEVDWRTFTVPDSWIGKCVYKIDEMQCLSFYYPDPTGQQQYEPRLFSIGIVYDKSELDYVWRYLGLITVPGYETGYLYFDYPGEVSIVDYNEITDYLREYVDFNSDILDIVKKIEISEEVVYLNNAYPLNISGSFEDGFTDADSLSLAFQLAGQKYISRYGDIQISIEQDEGENYFHIDSVDYGCLDVVSYNIDELTDSISYHLENESYNAELEYWNGDGCISLNIMDLEGNYLYMNTLYLYIE